MNAPSSLKKKHDFVSLFSLLRCKAMDELARDGCHIIEEETSSPLLNINKVKVKIQHFAE